jgi:hypothetical protein
VVEYFPVGRNCSFFGDLCELGGGRRPRTSSPGLTSGCWRGGRERLQAMTVYGSAFRIGITVGLLVIPSIDQSCSVGSWEIRRE